MQCKKVLRLVLPFILVLFVLAGLYVPVSAAPDKDKYVIVYGDEAGLIDEDGKRAILKAMQPLMTCGNVGFITTNDEYKSGTDFFRTEYYKLFQGESGVIFYIDMYDRNLYIWTDGEMGETLTVGVCNTITDNVYKYASKGNYTEASVKAFNQIYRKMSHELIPQPMKYICSALVSAFLALLIMYGFIEITNKKKTPSSKEWLGYIYYKTDLTGINTNLTSHVVHQSSGGSGGHYGGGHSGGGHRGSGGGGHHGGGHGGGHHF